MSVIDRILATPSSWTGERVLDELAVQMHDDARRADPSVPRWLRDVMVLLDFDTHVQMEGLLGWWENRASEDLDEVVGAFHAVGLAAQAALLERARQVLDPQGLQADPPPELYEVSSFVDRHGSITEQQYAAFGDVEDQLYLNADDGPDLHAALVGHVDTALADTG